MKKVLAILALTVLSTSAIADYGYHYRGGHYGGGGWIAPLVIGGIVGYAMSPRHENPVIIQQTPPQVYNNPTQPRVYNLGYPPAFPGARALYQESWQFEPSCQCQVKIYNQIGWQ